MKRIILMSLAILIATGAMAQETIKLNAPDFSRGSSLMKALGDRKSVREYSSRELSVQDMSDLLWAANGFNRTDKRTAATAMNTQEIDVYVCLPGGAYLYDAAANELKLIVAEDLRPLIASGQEWASTAPAVLLIAANLEKFRGGDTDGTRRMSAYDAGIVSQNIYLFCSGNGLATVVRAGMNHSALSEKLGLGTSQVLHLNHPVGYLK